MEDIQKYITASTLPLTNSDDGDNKFSLTYDETKLNSKTITEHYTSGRYEQTSSIITQNEVDRIASDGQNFLYFSDTTKSLCYIYELIRTPIMATREITARWRYMPVLDLIWSDVRKQYLCATKQGIYSCMCFINSRHKIDKIDVNIELAKNWSYVRLSVNNDTIAIWSDTQETSELNFYNPVTFEHTKYLDLRKYSRFCDNSTSFCLYKNSIATLFQFKQQQHYHHS
ncbi:unnamed protein product, partial [Didymodactylos carnosus]